MNNVSQLKMIAAELRGRLALCMLLVGASGLMIWIAMVQVTSLQHAHDLAHKQLIELQAKGRDLRDQLDHAKTHLARFESLADEGAIGAFAKQRRLDEVDTILRSGLVTPKTYALGAESPVTLASAQSLQHTVQEHRLSFEVSIAHELRLVALIERLASQEVGGLKGVEQCEVRRSDDESRSATGMPTLTAACQMAWYRFERKADVAPTAPMVAPLRQAGLLGRQP